MAWYTGKYRRHLCDMHIEDWDKAFLSEFSPEEYYQNLVTAQIQSPMIYLQSHVGYCYWPVKNGHMHQALVGKEDTVKRLIELCAKGGMDVVGYYSLVYNNWAHDRNPSWRIIDKEGKSLRDKGGRYGMCCPNNPDYRSFVYEQLEEIAAYFHGFKGMFFDMLFWPQICHCEHCRTKWKALTGKDIPEENWRDRNWLKFTEARGEWLTEFAAEAAEKTKRLMPGITVDFNLAALVVPEVEGGGRDVVESMNRVCDYTGGDLYGDIYNQSFTCKYYKNITKNQPFEFMTGRCKPSLSEHTTNKSLEELKLELMLTVCSHHGAAFVIDAIDPSGTMDHRVYQEIGKAFEAIRPYENYFKGRMIEDVGVYYSCTSRFNPDGQAFSNHSCAIGLTRTFIQNHVPFGILGNDGIQALTNYKMVFAPSLSAVPDQNAEALIRYVESGGRLYFSGVQDKLLQEFFGAKRLGLTESVVTYVAPKEKGRKLFGGYNGNYPMRVGFRLPLVEGIPDENMIAGITLPYTIPGEQKFASIHSNPPGIATRSPAMAFRPYGKGMVYWSAAPIEHFDTQQHQAVILNILQTATLGEQLSFQAEAPKSVEITMFKDGENQCRYLNVIDLRSGDEPCIRPGFHVQINGGTAKRIRRLPDMIDIPFSCQEGRISFRTEPLEMFDMYLIED